MTNIKNILLLGTYVPTEEGIATFTKDSHDGMQTILSGNLGVKIAAINYTNEPMDYPKEVIYNIDRDKKNDYEDLAKKVNNNTAICCVIIQHEYGIFGGEYGEYLLGFTRNLKKPFITIYHTMLPNPPFKMSRIAQELIDSSTDCLVFSNHSKKLVEDIYNKAPDKVHVIPHGIHPVIYESPRKVKKIFGLENFTVLTTFGLLSKSKGIEYVLRSLPKVVKKYPNVRYFILGATHPQIFKHEGEKYRNELIKIIEVLKLEKNVVMINKYFELKNLIQRLKATDIYIATSTNPEQAVSGTFSYALGTGRAVVSTRFKQAEEEIRNSVGRLVPSKNSKAYRNAILDLLSNKKRLSRMHRNAYRSTRKMLFTNVSFMNLEVIKNNLPKNIRNKIYLPDLNLNHLDNLTDDFGIIQFSKLSIPFTESGYTADDNARALIAVGNYYSETRNAKLLRYANIYLSFLEKCLNGKRFINYFDYFKKPTLQNNTEDLDDAKSRVFWALRHILANNNLPKYMKIFSTKLLLSQHLHNFNPTHLRPSAFYLKGLFSYTKNGEVTENTKIMAEKYSEILFNSLENNSDTNWRWFEDKLTYSASILPEALLFGGTILNQEKYIKAAVESMNFLISKTFMGGVFSPIGQKMWIRKKGVHSTFDQQPEDTAQVVIALIHFYEITKNTEYIYLARKAFLWFLGNNILGQRIYDNKSGGVYDGLTKYGVNENMGAEALVTYLMARYKIEKYL